MASYAQVIINNESSMVDRPFTYKIPERLKDNLKIGHRIKIPFGKGNKKIDGFVFSLLDQYISNYEIKEIESIEDDFTAFEERDIPLIEEMRERYLCTYIQCIKVIVPAGVFEGLKLKKSKTVYIKKTLEGKYKKEPYDRIYGIVKESQGIFTKSQLSKTYNISLSSINTLIKNGFIQELEEVVDRFDQRNYEFYERKNLNDNQREVVETILHSDEKKFLIHGITGSGKTEIYMNLVEKTMELEKDSIILVPEIALTPQMVERFKGRFGNKIAVFHSKLSNGERFDEWMRVKNRKVQLAIGARSAIFLPFNNLSLIVIDEEHESSYKSDSDPKYHAREIGEILQKNQGVKLVLGSATPSVETYFKANSREYHLLTLTKRADKATLPVTEIVDMREELVRKNKSMFSGALLRAIDEALSKKEQIILFLNRRGFSTFVSCRKCGFVFKCRNCDISLTYHHHNDTLSCHYCGSTEKTKKICPKCGSSYVKYFGAGTEKIEENIKKYFPSAKTIRMDFDTTRKKDAYEEIYNSFKAGNADILIGTQMIAKGLDFKNVTLVGVVAADISLNLPDFRSGERTFQLLTQVGGRAGRGEKSGKVIIQTYTPESYSIIAASNHDYEGFYQEEINLRKTMNYPPFSKVFLINISSKDEALLIKISHSIGQEVKEKLKDYEKIEILGPCPCTIGKVKENYRWQIILKGDIENKFAISIKNLCYEKIKNHKGDIKISTDLNPLSLL
ncbi:primosomal protein N' [Clostridium cellulovorans]|uniref:Replication restart protein PriA n=1 Tax=Clostridium cellulovorans (strain ATCC 35296 / DSM 3052 / OCM 3 / 743B) TaxID=573061 RepID=D9SLA0_CLOC7|nr:primosomal protein N' [Clostridium cellulovorans]ADL51616.1 primosomal protein N' [Clostridium cellulovorans 743B]